MTFTTLTFLLFAALVFSVYWILPSRKQQNLLVLAASYFFYGWWDWRFCGLMLLTSSADFCFGRAICRAKRRQHQRFLLSLSCCLSLAILGYFKYFNFFADSFVQLLSATGLSINKPMISVILPVGISFYTFQSLGYVIDVYRRDIQAASSFLDYLAYVSFFPQLVAGPIERSGNLLPQLQTNRSFDYAASVDGLRLTLWGFFKKLVVADNLAIYVNAAYGKPENYNGLWLAFATVCFAFQIYCDFSAYSDIASGVARLFGITLMRNFAYPYFSVSVGEFWSRWHISLSTWFRDYVYIPLGGSRVGASRRAFNLMFTFLVSGLWHGASLNFVIWGAVNGFGVLAEKWRKRLSVRWGGAAMQSRIMLNVLMLFNVACTFAFICLAWIFFRASGLNQALYIIRKIFVWPFVPQSTEWLTGNIGPHAALFMVVCFIMVEWINRKRRHPLNISNWPIICRWCLYTLMIWGMFYFRPASSEGFIYFQF